MTQEQIQQMQTAFNEFKQTNEQALAEQKKFGATLGDTTEKLTRLHTRFDTLETQISEVEKKSVALKVFEDRMNAIEAMLAKRSPTNSGDEKAADVKFRKQVLFKALRLGPYAHMTPGALTEQEQKALTVSQDPQGGYLAPPEYVNEVLMDVVQFSNVRSVARIRTTGATAVQFPRRKTTAAATWTSETGTRSETTNPSWGMEEIKTHEMHALIKVSKQDLEDSLFDIESFLKEEMSEQFGLSEGTAFISGDGRAKPEGITINTSITSINSGDANLLTADSLIALYYEIKEQYLQNANWLLNRATLKTIRQMKDGNGNYLWTPGIKSDAKPATILDRPYVTCPDMANIAASAVPVVFGDFRRGYIIVDRLVMEMLTDPFTSKGTGMIEFSARRRVGGQVILAEAIKKLTIAA